MARPLHVIIVFPEKELDDFTAAVEACKPKVGPMKILSAYKAVQATAKLQEMQTKFGRVDVVLMHDRFTAKGKEEYSDAVKKVLKEKFAHVPVVCCGHVNKGGQVGKDYHSGVDWSYKDGPAPLVPVLLGIKSGEITAEYKSKADGGRKSLDRRGSVDMKRKSIDSPTTDAASPARRTSLDHSAAASPAARRKSVDAGRKSLDAGHATGSPRGSLDIGGELNMSAPPACDSACLL